MIWITIFVLNVLNPLSCYGEQNTLVRDLKVFGEKAARTSIVTYKKELLTDLEIKQLMIQLKRDCSCNVDHLSHVGAFILTYKSRSHTLVKNFKLNHVGLAASEDGIVTTNELHEKLADHDYVNKPYQYLDDDGDGIGAFGGNREDPEQFFNDTIKLRSPDPIIQLSSRQTPNDPNFNLQWALQNLNNDADINAQNGWDEYVSDSQGGSATGPSVIVAVLDTGVDYNHPDLTSMMWTNSAEVPGNGVDDDGNGITDDIHGADFSSGTSNGDPMDGNGHGTHCAGVIGAKENNGVGITGVASFTQGKVKIMAVKGLSNSGSGTLSGMLLGLNYAISMGAKISSNSWGTTGWSNSWKPLWSNVLQNNPQHIFVASSGNQNQWLNDNNKKMACGLDEPNLLCVASSNKFDGKSYFSNTGNVLVHVFAPGSNVYSTWPNGQYKDLSGTSMACPHASGLAALILTMRSNLSGQEVRQLIEDNVQKKPHYDGIVSSGGLIDMAKTIIAVKNGGGGFSCPQGHLKVPGEFNVQISNTSICVDKMGVMFMRDKYGKTEAYSASGPCGLNTIANLPAFREGGGLAYSGGRLISFGGWYQSYGRKNAWEYNAANNIWMPMANMQSSSALSYYAYTMTTVGKMATGEDVIWYYSPYYGNKWALHYLKSVPLTSTPTWSIQTPSIPKLNRLNRVGVVSVGHFNIIFDDKGKIWKHNPNSDTNVALPDLPVNNCYYPKASLMERSIGVGIIVACMDGRNFFCLLEKLEWQTPSGWEQLASTASNQLSYLGYVEGVMHSLRGSTMYTWDESSESWNSSPSGLTAYQMNYGRTTWTSIPKSVINSWGAGC